MDPEQVTTITVDSYSTLVDIDAQAAALQEYVDDIDEPDCVSQLWRSQYIHYSMIANIIDEYRPFWELIGQGLLYALEVHGHDVSETVRDEIRHTVYEDRITVFDDVSDGITRLVDAGYDIYIVSNGTPEMLDHLVEAANLGGTITATISADEIETFKPDPELYRHAAARTGTPIDRILHVSGGGMRDVWGAKHAGMHAAWLARPVKQLPRESLGPAPDLVVADFHELLDRLV